MWLNDEFNDRLSWTFKIIFDLNKKQKIKTFLTFIYLFLCFFIFKTDPLLEDLPQEVTLEEVTSQLALEYGQAMSINVCRADSQVMRM